MFCGKDIPLTPFAHAQKKATRQGGIPTIGNELFCEKWGVTLAIVLFIVSCFIGCCVVFRVVGCAPCTPKLSAGRSAESGVYFELSDENCCGFLH